MEQNLFETVKQAITLKEAAKQYGLEVTRGGMVICPFHPDKNPSMKLNDDYYYCFGCGATGDVIDFVARLFQTSNIDGAKRLAADFGLRYDRNIPRTAPKRPAISAQIKKQRENYTFRTLAEYHHQLQEWLVQYDPKTPNDEIDPRFLEAVHHKDYVEYLMDVLISGTPEEKEAICAERNPVIRKIAHRMAVLTSMNQHTILER